MVLQLLEDRFEYVKGGVAKGLCGGGDGKGQWRVVRDGVEKRGHRLSVMF